MKNLVIVGGGTAGWLTALYAKHNFPNYSVTLIESEEYGILGAGEGSMPNLMHAFKRLGIDSFDLFRQCNASIKNGIKFVNWSVENPTYYHLFKSNSSYSLDPLETESAFSHYCAKILNHKSFDYIFMEKITRKNCVPFFFNNDDFTTIGDWAMHFDAGLVAKFLRQVAESRGIIRKEGIVTNFTTDLENNIISVNTNDFVIPCNFVFDCSGFKRLIIGNFYKSPWKSYSQYLPVKKAIPFFLPPKKEIPPYMEAVAMNYGWMWSVPLQHRYGCGYVFDSDFITEDEAKKELDDFLGFEVESPKTFSFNAGCYKNIWINNCLALGLSSGFIEPLEATSITQTVLLLDLFFGSERNITTSVDQSVRDSFNSLFITNTNQIVDFIYFHYITTKTTTKFWSEFVLNNKPSEFVETILNAVKTRPLIKKIDFGHGTFYNQFSYSAIALGNGLVPTSLFPQLLPYILPYKDAYLEVLGRQSEGVNLCMSHNTFLDLVKGSKLSAP